MSEQKRVLAEGKFLRLIVENGWEYVERTMSPSPVGIVAVTDDGKLLVIEQYRQPLGAQVIEIPAGLVGDKSGTESESLEVAAKRELLEESGYEAQTITFLTVGPTSAGLTSETVRLVRATGLRKVYDKPPGDEGENIRLIELPLTKARQWLADRAAEGLLIDAKVYAALWLAGG